ncbi:DUF2157 domain-containing protein [Porphyrobacter sp. YT40]|uniref:DUF2157 domain-containing protein n=1 Tax=Porphyrobacter sp. YT40 TaxID=2547601 RepID=UPI0011430944|nr:DUF2157 domain-containing protein [Porphyrobacter sp. YT40]QDH33172.1 DUF2157 domain-containing protein [Porphyrobacter sp. YT40]
MSARKIAEWHDAGLIDAATRDRLTAYEAEHTHPLLLWAVWGIGALAIGLGVVSVVAANWEDIPGLLRLGVHFALLAGLLALLVWREQRLDEASPWAVEALLFVVAALGLTFFGHIGQVYQTSSPLWQPLATWLVLFGPLLLLTGRSWPSAIALLGGMVWCAWEYAGVMADAGISEDIGWSIWLALVVALPVMAAPIAAAMRARSWREDFWVTIEQLALTYAVAGASFASGFASIGAFEADPSAAKLAAVLTCAAVALVAGAGVAAVRPSVSGRMTGAILAGAGAAMVLAYAADDRNVAAALVFFALWAGIAAAALAAQWRGVFQVAVGAIAVRLVILSFELAADLLMSGFGLILSGVLILGIGWAAVRVSRRFAPAREDAA